MSTMTPTFCDDGTSRVVEVDSSMVHFHDLGAGDPIVIHQPFGPMPGTTSWLTYSEVALALAEHFRCILIDYPNFGMSSARSYHEPVHDLYVRNAFAVLDHVGIDTVAAVGTSTGGTVAIDLALAAPDRVSRLVVGGCNASTGGDPYLLTPSPTEVARLFDECHSNTPDRSLVKRLLKSIVHDRHLVTDDLVELLYQWRVNEAEHVDAWAASVSVPHSNLAMLHTIDQPALVIHGRFDRMVPLEQALMLASYLPNADLVVLNNCGHWPAFERPRDFTSHVMRFLLDGQLAR